MFERRSNSEGILDIDAVKLLPEQTPNCLSLDLTRQGRNRTILKLFWTRTKLSKEYSIESNFSICTAFLLEVHPSVIQYMSSKGFSGGQGLGYLKRFRR